MELAWITLQQQIMYLAMVRWFLTPLLIVAIRQEFLALEEMTTVL